MYPETQVQNQPTAAYWLSMIGAILGLIGAIAFFVFGTIVYSAYNNFLGYYDIFLDVPFFGWGWSLFIGLGVWMLIASTLIIIFASKLKANPIQHTKWGVLILVFSIIGLGGGILALIGGILAIVYKPVFAETPQRFSPPSQTYPPQQQTTTRVCPQCGRIININQRICPNCGKQLE